MLQNFWPAISHPVAEWSLRNLLNIAVSNFQGSSAYPQ